MTEVRRALTDVACRIGAVVSAPWRRRGERELRAQPSIRRILVFNDVCGLGNLVQLSGLLLNLRRLFPQAHIAVAMPSSPLARTLLGPELADEVLGFEPDAGGSGALLSFAWRVLRPRRFDLALGTFFSPTLRVACTLALAGCRYRVAYADEPWRGFLNTVSLRDSGGHELDRHLRLLEFTGQPVQRRTRVGVDPQAIRTADECLRQQGLGSERPLLGVHPGCDRDNALKRWPVGRFVAVMEQVVERGLADVAVFLGPDDTELYPTFAPLVGPRLGVICSERFEVVAALIGRCHAFLSNDSGLVHVAAAQGLPVVAIFGPTDTVKNTPVGEATVLTAPEVPCRPCYTRPPVTCRYERRHCLEEIGVDRVVGAVCDVLASAPRAVTGVERTAGHAA